MQRLIFCHRLKKQAPGLTAPPYPGKLGQRIFESISQQAWQQWLQQQTLLINENRLNLLDQKARAFIEEKMEKFLFAAEDEKPPGYTPLT